MDIYEFLDGLTSKTLKIIRQQLQIDAGVTGRHAEADNLCGYISITLRLRQRALGK